MAAATALTAFENEVSNLVNETEYSTKIIEIEKKITDYDHDKYIPNPEFKKLAAGNLLQD